MHRVRNPYDKRMPIYLVNVKCTFMQIARSWRPTGVHRATNVRENNLWATVNNGYLLWWWATARVHPAPSAAWPRPSLFFCPVLHPQHSINHPVMAALRFLSALIYIPQYNPQKGRRSIQFIPKRKFILPNSDVVPSETKFYIIVPFVSTLEFCT